MLIDCDRCEVRDLACADCVVTVLLGPPARVGGLPQLVEEEQAALAVLADAGLVPPLRLVPDAAGSADATGGAADQRENAPWPGVHPRGDRPGDTHIHRTRRVV